MIHHSKNKEDDRVVAWATEAAKERLLNAYLREKGISDPRLAIEDPSLKLLSPEVEEEIKAQGILMKVDLSETGVIMIGALAYFSPFGHHRYGISWYRIENGNMLKLTESKQLAGALLKELACLDPNESERNNRVEQMLSRIENSIEKTSKYIQKSLQGGASLWEQAGEHRFCAAEQSLVYGHPFHPASKSSEGFSPEDLIRYAPEMGASFALHYFAVAPELVAECFLNRTELDLFPAEVLEAARQQLDCSRRHYRLLPCHPWQVRYLKNLTEVRELLETEKLIDLGPLGHPVYPTSSIRTVWDPEHSYFFKLPLNVRITNFVRVNPPEQLKRTMDASNVLESLAGQLPYSDFTILLERGYRTLCIPKTEQRDKLTESFAVIFRENPVIKPFEGDSPIVVATLLEHPPYALEPPLLEAIRLAAEECNLPFSDFLFKWMERYMEISLLPLLALFMEHGISIEAHVQNSMVQLINGWPERFFVRDLEGVSISRERAEQCSYFDGRLTKDSCALYSDQEAWKRLKYYVVVNHFGHLFHTLAYYGKVDEQLLWQKAGAVLRENVLFQDEAKSLYVFDLLEGEGLPAKANLVSCFQNRGETPLYVLAPNLFTNSEVRV